MIKKHIILFTILTILLTGCGTAQGSMLSILAKPTETPTPPPTATPEPSPTPFPTLIPVVRVSKGDAALIEGDYEAAQQEYELALNSSMDEETQAAALVGIGKTQYQSGEYLLAIQSFLTAIENYPTSTHIPTAYYYLGRIYDLLEQYEDAASAYQKYIEINPGVLDGYFHDYMGDSYQKAGSQEKAIEAYQQAIADKNNPDPLSVQIKIGTLFEEQGNIEAAIENYWAVYQATGNDYIKAQMDYLIGNLYLQSGDTTQAYTRFQDAVIQFPKSYHSYLSLTILLENNQQVDDYYRGLVDFYAGQYGIAINAFDRYMGLNPTHDGTGHYYAGLSYRALDQVEDALAEWDLFIENYPENIFWEDAWEDKAYTLWAYQQKHRQAAQTLLDLVSLRPDLLEAPDHLFEAGRIYERNGDLLDSAAVWERMMVDYPRAEISFRGLFLSGINYFRIVDYEKALIAFQRALVLATNSVDQSAAYFWIGKTQRTQNDFESAYDSWEQAALRDPTGYYSERARDLLLDRPSFTSTTPYDLGYDLASEAKAAEEWIRITFFIEDNLDLSSPGALINDPRIQRGTQLWELGLYQESLEQIDQVIEGAWLDPAQCFRLLGYVYDLGYYRKAILLSRQILDLANLDDVSTLNAPIYFNHIRFGVYYKDLVIAAAEEFSFHPLYLFSVIRQESLFEGFISSSVGARGLMQLMPNTAQEIVDRMGWPESYQEGDLNRPIINIPLGTRYLATQRDLFDQNLYFALAAYNAGPGNALTWKELAGGDSDLFLEIVRFDETRAYIMQIAEFLNIYRTIYLR